MDVEILKKCLPKKAGIYCFKNKINKKCYIGQSVDIRHRFLNHIQHHNAKRFYNPLYRAFDKYGYENFDFLIIEYIVGINDNKALKNALDDLEKFYIKRFNSYGANGYNQTLGGDYGVLGYKMTEEQIDKIRKTITRQAHDGRYTVYCYDIIENKETIYDTIKDVGIFFNTSRTLISNIIKNKKIYKGRYVFSCDKEDLYNIIKNKSYKLSLSKYLNNTLCDETVEYYNILLERFNKGIPFTRKEIAKEFGISESAVSKRNEQLNKYGYKTPWVRQGWKLIITDLTNNTNKIVTYEEASRVLGKPKTYIRKIIHMVNPYNGRYIVKRYGNNI